MARTPGVRAALNLNQLPRRDKGIDIRQKCRIYSRQALATVLQIMHNKEYHPMLRLKAAQEILDRGWGKASQQVDINVEHRLMQLSDAELRQHIQQLARDVGGQVGLDVIDAEVIDVASAASELLTDGSES